MYNSQERKVLDLLKQVEVAFNEIIFPNQKKGKNQSYAQRRSESVAHDNDATAFREGLAQLERNLKARAADRLNDLDLSSYVKEAVKDMHPNSEEVDFKVTFTNKEVTKSKMEITPSQYGQGISTRMSKTQPEDEGDSVTKSMMDDDDDAEDGY